MLQIDIEELATPVGPAHELELPFGHAGFKRVVPADRCKTRRLMQYADLSLSPDTEAKWWTFALLLLAATLVPLIFFPISVQTNGGAMGLAAIAAVLNFLGSSFHVGASGFFYADAEVRRYFRQNPWRYYLAPALLIVGSGIVFSVVNATTIAYLILAYFIWQTYHYQKQNYGILNFVAAATDRVRPTWLERAILQTSVRIGIVGLIKTYNLGRGTVLQNSAVFLHAAAARALWIVPALLLAAFAVSPGLRRNPCRMLCLMIGGLFYLPIFLFNNPVAAVSGYAIAHGLQYLVFMFFVGAAKPERNVRLIVLAATALSAGGFLALTGGQTSLWRPSQFVFGCYLGLVMSHFVIDAGIWKLRDAFPRAYMGRAFGFVFARGHSARTAVEIPAPQERVPSEVATA